jgi:hypothetical protein
MRKIHGKGADFAKAAGVDRCKTTLSDQIQCHCPALAPARGRIARFPEIQGLGRQRG